MPRGVPNTSKKTDAAPAAGAELEALRKALNAQNDARTACAEAEALITEATEKVKGLRAWAADLAGARDDAEARVSAAMEAYGAAVAAEAAPESE